jgi:hypothetical protein
MRPVQLLICACLLLAVCSCATTEPEPARAVIRAKVIEVAPGVSYGLSIHGAACRIESPPELQGRNFVIRPIPNKSSAEVPGRWPPVVGDILVLPPVPENLMVLSDDVELLETIYPGVLDEYEAKAEPRTGVTDVLPQDKTLPKHGSTE